MRTYTESKTVYTFNELSDEAKQMAINNRMEAENEFFDGETVYDDAKSVAACFGLELDMRDKYKPCIYYSGFSSQGDGACFEGSYRYQKGAIKQLKAYALIDTKLHRIAQGLQDIQKVNFYQLRAITKHSGHYYHSGCMDVDVTRYDDKEMTKDAEETVTQLLRDFADWIYNQLEENYDYATSEENAKEYLEESSFEFFENGEIA